MYFLVTFLGSNFSKFAFFKLIFYKEYSLVNILLKSNIFENCNIYEIPTKKVDVYQTLVNKDGKVLK